MNKPTSQHYVPQMLLRNFTDKLNRLHCFDKSSPEKSIHLKYPASFCEEDDIYTQLNENGERDVSAEKDFSDLENICAPIIRKIIKATRKRNQPDLTCAEKENLRHFFLSQYSRVPDRSKPFAGSRLLRCCIENPEKFLNMSEEKRNDFKQKENFRFLTLLKKKPSKKTLSISENEDMVIGIASGKNESFIIGSNPVQIIQPQGCDLDETWLAIAPDIAITVCSPRCDQGFIEFKDNDIHLFNEEIFNQSTEVAGDSKELIERVVVACGGSLY